MWSICIQILVTLSFVIELSGVDTGVVIFSESLFEFLG